MNVQNYTGENDSGVAGVLTLASAAKRGIRYVMIRDSKLASPTLLVSARVRSIHISTNLPIAMCCPTEPCLYAYRDINTSAAPTARGL